jgi:hypothetical protein
MGKGRTPHAGRLTRLFRGHLYCDYIHHRSAIEPIFASIFTSWSSIFWGTIEQATGIPHRRVYPWKRQWDIDPDWRPWNVKRGGGHHRVFTGTEERAISDYIIDADLTPGLSLTNITFVGIVMQAFLDKYQNSDTRIQFQCSPGFTCRIQKEKPILFTSGAPETEIDGQR